MILQPITMPPWLKNIPKIGRHPLRSQNGRTMMATPDGEIKQAMATW
jgi:hypothetical protein